MTETTFQFNPETKKPMPVSMREFLLMDRKEQRAFNVALTKDEKFAFQASVFMKMVEMPQEERREIQKEFVAKLEKREDKSIGDKVELVREKWVLASLSLPEKQPIFFRKLRNKVPFKSIRDAKSPYLIAS